MINRFHEIKREEAREKRNTFGQLLFMFATVQHEAFSLLAVISFCEALKKFKRVAFSGAQQTMNACMYYMYCM